MNNYCTHCFSVELATRIGMREAIILQHLYWWYQHNADIPAMNIDGRVWFFLSTAKIAEVFPYLSEKVVRTILEKLIKDGLNLSNILMLLIPPKGMGLMNGL